MKPLLMMAMSVLSAIYVSAAGPAFGTAPDFHYLAADPSLRAQTQNANVIMGQATYVGKVLELDQPWDIPFKLTYPGSVVIDPDTGQWRMYYEVQQSEHKRFAALATSTDGINWTKPALNITGEKYTDDPRNNFINNTSAKWYQTPNVFIDPTAPANQRYRMSELGFLNWRNTLYNSVSADGLNWERTGVISTTGGLDAQNNAFWDTNTQEYRAYMRHWYGQGSSQRRGVSVRLNATWDPDWTGPQTPIIDPIGLSPKMDIYCPVVLPYQGQYIGLPAMFYHPDGQHSGSGALYPTFMYSRDGITNWTFQDPEHPIIDLSVHGQDHETFGMAFPMTSPMPNVNGNLYIYYSYFHEQHDAPRSSGIMHLATIREDRFVGIQSAPGEVGVWTTSPIALSGDPGHLIVNSLVDVDGSVGVEVLDPLTMEPFAGYSANDWIPIAQGDFLSALARWNGIDNLNALADQTVVLRFTMDDATIYSFRFEPMPEPSTVVLLVCGGACLLVFRAAARKYQRRSHP